MFVLDIFKPGSSFTNCLLIILLLGFSDIKGTYNIVIATVAILKEIIINAEWSTAQ